ncbi:MAG TPA: hypothetical protein VE987_18795 [Polyangiaceae bacterium]|nr:hypothetical protein [Polyangiaceae bacterium]
MVHRLMRTVVFAAVTVALWALARPASAMPAGLCDDRGATAIASPPSLEAPDIAVERVRAPARCSGDDLPWLATVKPAHGVAASPALGCEPALPLAGALVAAPQGQASRVWRELHRAAQGVRARVERPPRG